MSRELDAAIHFSLLSSALILYFIFCRKKPGYLKYAGFFLLVTFFVDLLAAAIMFNKALGKKLISNLFLYHILTPIQYIFVSLLYKGYIKSYSIRRVIGVSIFLFPVVSLLISSFIQKITDYNSYSLLLKYCLIVIWVLLYLRQLIVLDYKESLTREPIFWVSTGLLIHSVGNIFVEGVANYLINRYGNYFTNIYYIYSILNYILFIFFGVAFLNYKDNK